ncbi:RNA polymerase sigma factor/ type III [Synechococcus sp. BIOS-U3-1]|nr:RNA polymerase sigma factor/ type III [Synechococcus sp. BIOS-U3-1]
MDPSHRRWLCAFWIDGLSLTEIACKEHIDQPMLRRALQGALNSLRAKAGLNFSPIYPEPKRK